MEVSDARKESAKKELSDLMAEARKSGNEPISTKDLHDVARRYDLEMTEIDGLMYQIANSVTARLNARR